MKIVSGRTEHAARVKSLANELLRKRFGSGGSSNRLFSIYKTTCSGCKSSDQSPHSARSFDRSRVDVGCGGSGGFYRHKSLETPCGGAATHSLNVNFDLENINTIQGQPSLSMKNRNFKMAERR